MRVYSEDGLKKAIHLGTKISLKKPSMGDTGEDSALHVHYSGLVGASFESMRQFQSKVVLKKPVFPGDRALSR